MKAVNNKGSSEGKKPSKKNSSATGAAKKRLPQNQHGKTLAAKASPTKPATEKRGRRVDSGPNEAVRPSAAAQPNLTSQEAAPSDRKAAFRTLNGEPFFTDYDIYLFREGRHLRLYEKLGAHLIEQNGTRGVHFAVWAPNASAVSVVGDFNHWDGREDPLNALGESGLWAGFVRGLDTGTLYKYELHGRDGNLLALKADPFGFAAERSPGTASRVWTAPRLERKEIRQTCKDPISIYEVHVGSWRRGSDNTVLTYAELGNWLIPYVKELGFTHIEFMPVSEHPFDGSWGYQPVGLFAPTSRFGSPDDFAELIERIHQAGIGVLLDWVPAHFPTDAHGLARFDGTSLYEHEDPREGKHQDWGTLIYNFGRTEVLNFLMSNALFWFARFAIDGLRVDAVASMIYRNYSRKPGEWIPNKDGGVANLEATSFLRTLNEKIYEYFPAATTIAEESTAWPGVSRPTYDGGLGFGFKWNLGWMHDTLNYMGEDPVNRKYHHHQMTFGLLYAFTENFILPLSHDETVHGKRSILGRMPGDEWQKFANLRAYYAFMYCHPGKKLLFMGCEFGQQSEWNHNQSLDWHLLDFPLHKGVQYLIRDLNFLYRDNPCLHAFDSEARGFEWISSDAAEVSVLAFLRREETMARFAVCVSNFTPVVRYDYRIGVPEPGYYEERINTDASCYGGSNVGNSGGVHADDVPWDGRAHSLRLTLPPLATIVLFFRGA